MQQKDLYNITEQQSLESESQDFSRCNSFEEELRASQTFVTIRNELLDAGMPEEDFNDLIGLLKAIARRCLEEEFPLALYNHD
ncbi:MAG: hypothetical protein AAF611_07830 [Bacteroidota bacterium]